MTNRTKDLNDYIWNLQMDGAPGKVFESHWYTLKGTNQLL